MKERQQLLGETIVSQHGLYSHVKRYYSGWFEPKGMIAGVNYWWVEGLSGHETMLEKDVIRPIGIDKRKRKK